MSNNITIILSTSNTDKDTIIKITNKKILKPIPPKYKSALELIAKSR